MVATDSHHDAVAEERTVALADLAAEGMICVGLGMVAAGSSLVEVVAEAHSRAAADRLQVTGQ